MNEAIKIKLSKKSLTKISALFLMILILSSSTYFIPILVAFVFAADGEPATEQAIDLQEEINIFVNQTNATEQITTSTTTTTISNTSTTSTTIDSAGVIGKFIKSNEIIIESQDYIDTYIDWSFQEINNTHWNANFTINQTLLNDIKYCRSLPLIQRPACWLNLKNTYFPEYNLTQLIDHITEFFNGNYPLINLTENIGFSDFQINLTEGKASFNIIFPEGFKEGEKASFGFGTTVANTITDTTPFNSRGRAICRTTNKIHVAFQNGTQLDYYNSSDGMTWTGKRLDGSATGDEPSAEPAIACKNNDVFIAWIDSDTRKDIHYMNSTNEGATWSPYVSNLAPLWEDGTAVSDAALSSPAVMFGRANNIWVVWAHDDGTPETTNITNSTSYGGDLPTRSNYYMNVDLGTATRPSLFVNVSGNTEMVYVPYFDDDGDADLYINYSTNSGST